MPPKKQVRAAVYARLSKDKDRLSTSISDQMRECLAYAEKQDWLVEVFADNDVPASEADSLRKKPRPAYRQLLKAVEGGEVTKVIIWATDRLYRHPLDLERLIALHDECGVEFVALHSSLVDLSTADGIAQARIGAAMNAAEVGRLKERMKRKTASNARAGKPHGGARSFGYAEDRVTIVEDEAEAIRDAARRLLNGESLTSVTSVWNARGLRTTKGNPWKTQVVGRLLKSPRIAGLREHLGEVYPATWEPILDRRTWKALSDHLNDPRRVSAPTRGKYLLTGLLVCSECGARMAGQPVRGTPAYACLRSHGGCNRIRIMAAPLEEYVSGRAAEVALTKERKVPDPGKIEKRLAKAMDAEEAKLGELARDRYDRRVIGDIEYQAAARPIRERLAALEGELAEVAAPPSEGWSAFWEYLQILPDSFGEWLTDPQVRADVRADLERKVERIMVGKAGKSGRWAERPRVPKVRKNGKPSLRRDETPVMVPVGESRPASVSNRVAITWRQGVTE